MPCDMKRFRHLNLRFKNSACNGDDEEKPRKLPLSRLRLTWPHIFPAILRPVAVLKSSARFSNAHLEVGHS